MITNETNKPNTTKTIVVYAGRYQPFHKGHYASYKKLVNKFGIDNVYIGTSNDTSSAKSPFNFSEKKKIATSMFDIPPNRFVQIKNPYQPVEILKKYDGQTTQYIAAVGEKDADRLSGKYFKPYKGKAGYGYDEIGYVYPVPSEPNPISGTEVRNNLGNTDKEKAKEFFANRAYPKYNNTIFKLITSKLSEDISVDVDTGDNILMGKFKNKKIKVNDIGKDSHGMPTINGRQATTFRTTKEGLPGGAGVGLNLPGGYINGAPSDEDENEPYNPIKEIMANIIADAELYMEDLITEKGVMNKPLDWADPKTGKKKTSTVGGILRKGEEHPGYKAAKALIAKSKEPENGTTEKEPSEPKIGGQPMMPKATPQQRIDKLNPARAKEKAAIKQGELEPGDGVNPNEKPAGTLEPKDFKASAESPVKLDSEKTQIRMHLDDEIKSMSPNDQEIVKDMNNPESKIRQQGVLKLKDSISKFGKGISHWAQHKKEMLDGCGKGINNLMHGRKLGSLKVPDGVEIQDERGNLKKYASFRDLQSVDDKGQPEFEEIETTDKNGNTKIKKKPKVKEGIDEKEVNFFNTSYKRYEHESHGIKHTAIDVGLLVGSMMLGGAGVAAGQAAIAGQGISGVASAAAQGAIGVFTHGIGGFTAHLTKDIAKHATLETLGFGATQAASGGAGLSIATAGLLEMISENINTNDFVKNILNAVTDKVQSYKLSDAQLLKSIQTYKEKKPKDDMAKLLQPNTSDNLKKEAIDTNNLNKSIKYNKVKAINDFVEYTSKRLNLKETPKIKLVTSNNYKESQSLGRYDITANEIFVSVENRLTADILRTVAHELAHRKQDEMGLIRNPEEDGKTGSPIENKAHIVAGILMREYGKLNKNIFEENIIKEASSITSAGEDAQPDGAFLPKGFKRTLGVGNGVNKSDDWFKNGGYIQIEFPEADAIFGDEDQDQPYVVWKVKNLPRTNIKPTKFNKKNPINEGGAYGHMSHPFDDMDLTFGDLKNIITGALNGRLELTREKTDGQALAISWKSGRLIAARNKGHLANAGKNALGIEDVASKFAGRGGLTDAYNFAMKDLHAAISGLSDAQRKKIFNEGKCFMNLEVIWPESVNVIPYGQALLVFHNATCYDDSGVAISANQPSARILAGMIKQINGDVQSKYTIQGPPITSIPKNEELSNKQGTYLSKLAKLQKEFKLADSANVANYHEAWWSDFIDKKAPIKVDKLTKQSLIRRWAFGDKSFRLNTISNTDLQEWAVTTDKKDVMKQQKDNIRPFEEIFLGVGSDVLSFVASVLTVHPDTAIRNMKDRLKDVSQKVKNSGNPALIQKLKMELQRLNQLGGVDKIVASEGIVFVYKNKTYKLTGTFAPLNQLLGIFYE